MDTQKPVPIPLSQRLDDLRRGPLALAVWLVAAFGAWTLLERQADRVQLLGLAESTQAEVSSDVDGRLVEVLVVPFEDVVAGQVLARLDDAPLLARLESLRADVAALDTEVAAARATFQRELLVANPDRAVDLRRLQLDEEGPRLERLEQAIQIEADLVERARIEQQLTRADELANQGLAPEAERDDLILRRDRLTARVAATRDLVAELEAAEAAAAARRAAFEAELPADLVLTEAELDPLRARVRAAALRVEELQIERRSLTLTSPLGGRVRSVLAGSGQALLAGEPVATVTGIHTESILTWLPAGSYQAVLPGARVEVWRATAPDLVAEAVVAQLGPAVEELPRQLWRDPAVAEYGRPVQVTGLSALALTPGEVACVRPVL